MLEINEIFGPTIQGEGKLVGSPSVFIRFGKCNFKCEGFAVEYETPSGGGTTDYAVEIFYEAIEEGKYKSFISENTAMPMLYMNDAINATLKLMEAPSENLTVRSSYNLGGMSFTPKELAAEIKKEIPEFEISYEPDFRQAIADSWPASIDDSVAKKDWGLTYDFGITEMTKDMIKNLKVKLGK